MDDQTRKLEMAYHTKAREYTSNQLKIQGKSAKDPIFPTIEPESREWLGWERYFREYLGFDPLAMQRVRMKLQKSMTVPTQWPEWFDSSYTVSDRGGHYIAPRREAKSIEHAPPEADFFELTAKHGRPHGPFEKTRQLPYKG